jgi:hypothetical protein
LFAHFAGECDSIVKWSASLRRERFIDPSEEAAFETWKVAFNVRRELYSQSPRKCFHGLLKASWMPAPHAAILIGIRMGTLRGGNVRFWPPAPSVCANASEPKKSTSPRTE